jgi:hypothetical protein
METTTDKLSKLSPNETLSVELFSKFIEDTVKFRSKGTASAAARARKSASSLAKLIKALRKELQEAKVANAAAKKAAKQAATVV